MVGWHYRASGSPSKRAEDKAGSAGDLENGDVPDVLDGDEDSSMLSSTRAKATVEITPRSPSPLDLSDTAVATRGREGEEPQFFPRRFSGDLEQTSVSPKGTGTKTYAKWVAVAVLVFQNSGTNVIMPLARSTEWNSQSAVINQEIAKGVASVLALLWGGGFSNLAEALRPTPEVLKTAVPALLFLLQNNLQYLAAGYLSPTLFACLYQLKILSAALLSMALLQKHISCKQWAALSILVVGAALVVLGHVQPKKGEQSHNEGDLWRGVVLILMGTCLSGLAGVYFEKLLKESTVTLAARNLQLASYSAVIGFVVFFQSGGSAASFLKGYTAMVWVSIANNAFGGLIVAVVIKYADNIWKNFATTISIVLTSFVQAVFLGGSLGPGSLLGVALVVSAVLLYSGVCPHGSPTSAAQPPGPSPETIGLKAGRQGSPSNLKAGRQGSPSNC